VDLPKEPEPPPLPEPEPKIVKERDPHLDSAHAAERYQYREEERWFQTKCSAPREFFFACWKTVKQQFPKHTTYSDPLKIMPGCQRLYEAYSDCMMNHHPGHWSRPAKTDKLFHLKAYKVPWHPDDRVAVLPKAPAPYADVIQIVLDEVDRYFGKFIPDPTNVSLEEDEDRAFGLHLLHRPLEARHEDIRDDRKAKPHTFTTILPNEKQYSWWRDDDDVRPTDDKFFLDFKTFKDFNFRRTHIFREDRKPSRRKRHIQPHLKRKRRKTYREFALNRFPTYEQEMRRDLSRDPSETDRKQRWKRRVPARRVFRQRKTKKRRRSYKDNPALPHGYGLIDWEEKHYKSKRNLPYRFAPTNRYRRRKKKRKRTR